MSEQVASQTSNFPDDHGASDMPSGLLPSVLSRPVGSNREGMPAVVMALLMMEFLALEEPPSIETGAHE